MHFFSPFSQSLEVFTHRFAKWAGSATGFVVALLSILVWFIAGAYFGFSNKWEGALTVYIGVTTFLMVFLMERAQNKELSVIQVKLSELIATTIDADNHLINLEEMTEKEISVAHEIHSKIVPQEVIAVDSEATTE